VSECGERGERVTSVRRGPGRRRSPQGRDPRVPRLRGTVARLAPREPSVNGAVRPAAAPGRDVADRPPPEEAVRYGLRVAAGYAWRTIAVAAAVYLVFVALGRVSFVAVAVFVGLLITALLRPLTDLLARRLPRGLAVAVALIQAIVVVFGVFTFVVTSAVAQFGRLIGQFATGIREIEALLSRPPLRLPAGELNRLSGVVLGSIAENRGELAARAAGEAGLVAELFTGLALAVFCSLFFLHSGERMWGWVLGQLPVRRWDAAARAGWTAFAGYTRGVVVVAVSNATLVGIALFLLKVPLALPLCLLVLLGAFIPLIGAPIALAFATLVALAGRGPLTALAVLVLIVVIGQIEGHVLHPMIMSRAVKLHPVVVAVSVACGTVLAGIIGAVVAVPMVAVAWATFAQLRATDPEARAPDPKAPEPRAPDPPPPDAPVTPPVVP
jgi:putative heme transporter